MQDLVGPALGTLALVAAGGYLLGNGLVRARDADRSVTVRGLAEKEVTADLATWTIAYSATAEDLATAQASSGTKMIQPRVRLRSDSSCCARTAATPWRGRSR